MENIRKIFVGAILIVAVALKLVWWADSAPKGDEEVHEKNGLSKDSSKPKVIAFSGRSSSLVSHNLNHSDSVSETKSASVDSSSRIRLLFRETQKCTDAYRAAQFIDMQLKICERESAQFDSPLCSEAKSQAVGKLPQLKEELARCDGVGTEEFEDLRFEIIAEAAKTGDADAQVCFVQSDFDLRNMDMLSQSIVGQYKAEATRYVDSGMARGDWRIPYLFTKTDHALSHNHGLFPILMPRDELTRYRMMRLLRYGAVGSYASTLDSALAEYTEARANGLRGYPPEQLAAADEWARLQYEKSFANSPPLEGRPKICAD